MNRRRLVRVPASSANLGPGFDVLAAALGLHVELEVEETGRFAVHTDLSIARDRRNLAVRAFETLHPADDFEFTIRSDVPLSGGLGTSAAAYVAGLMAADSIFELDVSLLAAATKLEGPSRQRRRGAARRLRGLRGQRGPRASTSRRGSRRSSSCRTSTSAPPGRGRRCPSRCRCPTRSTTSATPVLVLGLRRATGTSSPRGSTTACTSRGAQPLYPQSMALLRRAQELGALGATISGAGPTVLFWTHYEATGAVMAAAQPATAGWAQVMHVPFEPQGAYVREL